MRRIQIWAFLLFISALPARADVRPPPEFYARAEALADWIDKNSDYGPLKRHPIYLFVGQNELNYILFEPTSAGYQGHEQSDAVALYFKGIVFLAEDFELGTHDYVLLHELVHHLQAEQERQFPCVRAGEKDAYELQARFVRETGTGEIPDPMWTLLAAQCHD